MGRNTVGRLFVCAFIGLILTVITVASTPQRVHAQDVEASPTPLSTSWVGIARDRSRQPPMSMPWKKGEKWIMSGGPHANSAPGITTRAALDFAPEDYFKCVFETNQPLDFDGTYSDVVSATPGLVTVSGEGWVVVDLDGDGDNDTGWVLHYFHMEDTPNRAKVGTYVQPGDVLGSPGCTYGGTTLEHLHLFRTFDGVHIAVDDRQTPFNLSGWTFQPGLHEYDGTGFHDKHGLVERYGEAIESDNTPSAYAFLSNLDLANLEFSGQTIRFKIPGTWLKPRPIVKDAKLIGSFVEGRLIATDKNWLLPVASQTLSSDEEDHTRPPRDSVWAWDLSAVEGAAVYPLAPGVVKYAGCDNRGNYGCYVIIEYEDGYRSLFAHLINERDPNITIPRGSAGDPSGYVLVRKDQKVDQWTRLGRVGWTGYTEFGPHVHFELVSPSGQRVHVSDYFDADRMVACDYCKAKEWTYDVPFTGRNVLATSDSFIDIPVEIVAVVILYVLILALGMLVRSDKAVQRRPILGRIGQSQLWQDTVRLMAVFGTVVILLSAFSMGSTMYINAQPIPDVFSEMLDGIDAKDLEELVQELSQEFANLDFEKLLQLPQGERRVAWATYVATNSEIKIPWMPVEVMKWAPEITTAARRHGIDPEFLAIICWVESKGDPTAQSHAGAVGLVQVMPATAGDIARQRGIENYDLWDPETNLDFGAWYLAQQLKNFGRVNDPDNQQSVELAAIAYNGGPGAAMDYIAGRGIPGETQKYLALVGGMWRERHQLTSQTFLGRTTG